MADTKRPAPAEQLFRGAGREMRAALTDSERGFGIAHARAEYARPRTGVKGRAQLRKTQGWSAPLR